MTKPMEPRVKIESDGTPLGTKVTHVKSGADITDCARSVSWVLDGHNLAEVKITLCGAFADASLLGTVASLKTNEDPEDDSAISEPFVRPMTQEDKS
jgi:hypothetical protein